MINLIRRGKSMEILDLYNDLGEKLNETIIRGQKPTKGKNVMLSVIFIKNKEGKYLIQKTSQEKGSYFASTGGHVAHKENSFETIKRELKEELDLNEEDKNIKYITTFKYPTKNCLFNVYLLVVNNLNLSKIKLQKEEVERVMFLTSKQIKDIIKNGNFLETHAYIFENYINC